ncbi:hypothetical protein GQ600_19938 [Phytophthora cactorum]|nr:hypothetical protein GQ600_19938 [Phytophthora cactorum]
MRPLKRLSSEKGRYMYFRIRSRGTCTLSASNCRVTVYGHAEPNIQGYDGFIGTTRRGFVLFRTQKRGTTVLCRQDFPGLRSYVSSRSSVDVELGIRDHAELRAGQSNYDVQLSP